MRSFQKKWPAKKDKVVLEQHYTPSELAERWGLSDEFIRALFRNEEGVLRVERPESMHKRGYSTMRIPESVAERVHARLMAKKKTRSTSDAEEQDQEQDEELKTA